MFDRVLTLLNMALSLRLIRYLISTYSEDKMYAGKFAEAPSFRAMCLLFLIMPLTGSVEAQILPSSHRSQHAFFLEFLGNGASLASFNYEYTITEVVALRGGIAYNWILGDYLAIPVSVSYLSKLLSENHRIEGGIGATFLIVETGERYESDVLWTALVAYRYQRDGRGVYLRPDLTLFGYKNGESEDIDFELWPALGIGYSF